MHLSSGSPWDRFFKSSGFLVIILFAFALLYRYPERAFQRPQSIHKWRQSDCASLARNYYQGGMHFFQPETHNLTSEGGTSGRAYTSEIPLLYYSVAFLYRVLGPHEWIYRILNTLLFLLGLFFLAKTFRLTGRDPVWSVLLALLFFTSPVLVYYGNNFLTNSTELAFSFMGWYFFLLFREQAKSRWFFLSMVLFFLGASMKITAFFSFFAIGLTLLAEITGLAKFGGERKLYPKPAAMLGVMAFVFATVLAWILYAHFSNKAIRCTYFSTVLFPIWDLDRAKILDVLRSVKELWLFDYFHLSLLVFHALLAVFVLWNYRRLPLFWRWVLPFTVLEALVYVLFQFRTFADHDYYTIGLFIVPALFLMAALELVGRDHPRLLRSVWIKGLMALLLLFNIFYARGRAEERYGPLVNDYSAYRDVYTLEPYLRELGLTWKDTVVSIPDRSHATLYLMNQKGWTEYTDASFNRGEWIRYNNDPAALQASIKRGASYLIVNGLARLYEKPWLQAFCNHLKGNYRNVFIFDLKNNETNFVLPQKRIKNRFFCDAEQRTPDSSFFEGEGNRFENARTRSTDEHFSGNASVSLNATAPYGMTLRRSDHIRGESYCLRVWRKQQPGARGEMVVQINGQIITAHMPLTSRPDGWEQLQLDLFIDDLMEGKEAVLFLHNPSETTAFFDDFEILHYESVYNDLGDSFDPGVPEPEIQ